MTSVTDNAAQPAKPATNAALLKKISEAEDALSRARGRRRDKGSPVQSMQEVKIAGRISRLRAELHAKQP